METLRERAEAQDIAAEPVDVRDVEPHATGIGALHVPSAGIVDYPAVCEAMAEEIGTLGGRIRLSTPVVAMRPGVIETRDGAIAFRKVVGCAGLQADRIARISACRPGRGR